MSLIRFRDRLCCKVTLANVVMSPSHIRNGQLDYIGRGLQLDKGHFQYGKGSFRKHTYVPAIYLDTYVLKRTDPTPGTPFEHRSGVLSENESRGRSQRVYSSSTEAEFSSHLEGYGIRLLGGKTQVMSYFSFFARRVGGH
eukprot:scaffold3310_cov81-Cylindrotheca_fusiformis.AAC.2